MALPKIKLSATINNIRLISGGFHILRQFSTAGNPPVKPPDFDRRFIYHRLSSIWSTGEKITDVLDQLWRSRDRNVNVSDLLQCITSFRKYGRYHYCLEILDWLNGKTSYKDYALRLNLIYKARSIGEAEKYFDSIPVDALKRPIYGALLNCYCSEKMIDKALTLFEKMYETKYPPDSMEFTNLMCLYMKVDQPEQVPPLVAEMKRRNIQLTNVSYRTWLLSYGRLNNLKGVEQVIGEIQKQEFLKNDWTIYSTSASVFINAGKYEKAAPFMKKLEEIIDKSYDPDRTAYHFLMTLNASVGDSQSVARVWDKFRSKFKACNNQSYLVMLQALSKLGNLEHLKTCFEEWNTRYKSYDIRLPNCVTRAYLRHGMFDEAKLLLSDATERAGQKILTMHLSFMDYFLEKCEIKSALEHLETALGNGWQWQQTHEEKICKFFEYFVEAKDVEGAETLCRMLEKDQPLTSTVYLWLVQTYAAAGKTAPELRQRMTQSGIDVGTEHEELLEKVCPN